MTNNINNYLENIRRLLNKLQNNQAEQIYQAAEIIAASLQNQRWLYVFGSGHSHMVAEEFFYRAGGLARIWPILDSSLMLHESATKSTALPIFIKSPSEKPYFCPILSLTTC